MKKILFVAAVLVIPMSLVMVDGILASDCSNAMVEAMLEEGLNQDQINRICLKAAMKEEGLSDEQIGRIISKTATMPTVSSRPRPADVSAPPASPVPVIAPAPAPAKVLSPDFPPSKIDSDIIGKCVGGLLGWCFEDKEYREIEILETDIFRDTAKVIFFVETIKDHSGKLVANYRQVAGQWKLDSLKSITFQ